MTRPLRQRVSFAKRTSPGCSGGSPSNPGGRLIQGVVWKRGSAHLVVRSVSGISAANGAGSQMSPSLSSLAVSASLE